MKLAVKAFLALVVMAQFTVASAFCPDCTHLVDDVYDFFQPHGKTQWLAVLVRGNLPQGKVSLREGKKEIVPASIEGVQCVYAPLKPWGAEDVRAFSRVALPRISHDSWTKVTITFFPRLDGKVMLSLEPEYGTSKQMCGHEYVRFFQIAKAEINGASAIKDPMFEKKNLRDWGYRPSHYGKGWEKKLKFTQVKDPDAPGGKYVRTCRNLQQIVSVKKDKMVTFSFYVRADDEFEPKK